MTTTSTTRTQHFDQPLSALDNPQLVEAWTDWFDQLGIPTTDVTLGYDLEVNDAKQTVAYRGNPTTDERPWATTVDDRARSAFPRVTVSNGVPIPPFPSLPDVEEYELDPGRVAAGLEDPVPHPQGGGTIDRPSDPDEADDQEQHDS